jgi:hypothetical protein|uniref:Uncharacterized protein n=1 Tax=Mimiviridae sp. ChoanoV1 TaxID=2596887 RepID=A0A5B8IDT0_9VIRU|nr:hypothetical protein 2_38 [Mimiviridae sp. ChoanoV1]
MSNSKPRTKKKSIKILRNKKKSLKSNKSEVDNKIKYLENHKNPIYKKYLDEFGLFFKNKKRNDKAKKKSGIFEFTKDKLIQEGNKKKLTIKRPQYILLEEEIPNTINKLNELKKEIHYINNLVDFSEDELPKDVKDRYQSLRKEYLNIEKTLETQNECINKINEVLPEEQKAEKEMKVNSMESENRDLYFKIKEKLNIKENISELVKEYLVNKKKIEEVKKSETKEEINFLIDKLPEIEK